MEDLRKLAEQAKDETLLSCFPKKLLRRWLIHSKPELVLKRLQDSQKTLEELRSMEKMADTEVLRSFFMRGEMCVRGFDRNGLPIMWGRHPKNASNLRSPYTEVCLYHMWYAILNCRRRKDPEIGAVVLYNEYDRKLLDFNFHFSKELFRLIGGLSTDLINSNVLVFVPNPLFACIGNLAGSCVRSFREHDDVKVSIRTNREEYLLELRDPNEIPDTFLPSGKGFTLSFESSGNWRDLVEKKNAFENMTLKDIFFPDPCEFEALRRRVEDEEEQLMSSVPRRISEGRASSHGDSHESDESDFESIAGDGEFLM